MKNKSILKIKRMKNSIHAITDFFPLIMRFTIETENVKLHKKRKIKTLYISAIE